MIWLWRNRIRTSVPENANCRQVGRVLQTYLDGEFDDEAAVHVARHLEECRDCGLEASTYTSIKDALGRASEPPAPGALRRLREFATTLAGDVN